MERQSCGTNRNSKSRRIPYGNAKELGTSNKSYRRSIEDDEKII